MPIPVNIITGVLGVGKTTAIRHLISQRPPTERWAVVVNEFGALGIDGAVLDTAGGLDATGGGDSGVTVREVAGGCLCCAVAAPFTVAVTQVLRRAKPGRLLIEPSGMGHPGGLFDALSGEHLGKTLELRATIALVDMAVGLEPCATEVARRGELFNSEAFRDQVACADVVVGARADTASEAEVAAFFVWAGELYPAKSHVTTIAHGELSLDILDIACGPTAPVQQFSAHAAAAAAAAAAGGSGGGGGLGPAPIPTAVMPGKPHRVLGGTAEFKTIGWVFSREDVFVRPRLTALFEALESEPRVVRFKGVIRVGAEWVMPVVDTTGGVKRVKLGPIAYRRDSRLEIIVMASSSAGDDGGGEGGGGEEVESVDGVEEWECAGRAAAAGDWDALEAAIKAAIRPPMAVKC